MAWSKFAWVVLIIGFAATHEVAARDNVERPDEVLVMLALGPDRTLDPLRAFADAVDTGSSKKLTASKVRGMLADSIGAPSLDGLDATAPTYLLMLDDGASLHGRAIVGKIADQKALGQLSVHSVFRNGWAVLGDEAIVTKVAPYALAKLPTLPAVTGPTTTLYVAPLLKRFHAEVEAARQQAATSMAQGSTQLKGLLQGLVDGLFATLADTDRVVATFDVTADVGAVDVALVPVKGSRLAKFITAQQPSDFSLLAKLPLSPAMMVMAGHLESGPYHQGLVDLFSAMYGQGGNQDITTTIAALMTASTGELAAVMQVQLGQPMTMTQLIGIRDQKSADRAIDRLLVLFKEGRTIEVAGVGTTIKTSATSSSAHDGVAIRGYDVTYDTSHAPAATRASMEKMVPNGTVLPYRIVTLDHAALITMGSSDPGLAIDAARGKGDHFALNALITDFLVGARARKDSFMAEIELGAMLGKGKLTGGMVMSIGFADHTAHLRVTMPAASIRALTGRP